MENEKEIGHIDLSPQINNPWTKDSALAFRKGRDWFAVKIRGKDKQEFKKLFIVESRKSKESRKNNQRVIVIIYSYMLYQLLKIINNACKKIKVCNDAGPGKYVNHYLTIICNSFHEDPFQKRIKLDFRKKKDGKSKAHSIARDVARGKERANLELRKHHLLELEEIIRRNIVSKVGKFPKLN